MSFNLGNVGFYALLLVGATAFAAVAGMISSWVDRKVTALVHARRGPPPLQPFYDFFKLMGKENVRPEGAAWTYALMPLVALAAASLAAAILLGNVLWQNGLLPSTDGGSAHGLVGDLIVVLYLLAVPSLALVLGASASNNPFASVGASREMKLMSYELPLLLAVAAALALASASEQRFARELQEQVDVQLPGESPLVSKKVKMRMLREAQAALANSGLNRESPEAAELKARVDRCKAEVDKAPASGPLAAAVPLRFDGVLVLRGAGPGAAPDLLAERGASRIRKVTDGRFLELNGLAASYGDLAARLKSAANKAWKAVAVEGSDPPAPAADAALAIDSYNEMARDMEEIRRLASVREQRKVLDPLADRIVVARAKIKEADARRDGEQVSIEVMTLAVDGRRVSEMFSERAKAFGSQAQAVRAEAERILEKDQRNGGYRNLSGAALAGSLRQSPAGKWAGLLALALCVTVVVLCAQAKLGLVPFDCAEAETELAGGVFIEYGGPLLGLWKLSRHMLLFLLPVFIGVVFLGGFRFSVPGGSLGEDLAQAGVSLLKYVGILVVFVLVRNTNPRVRIDQAMRFFLGPLTVLAAIALVLAVAIHMGRLG